MNELEKALAATVRANLAVNRRSQRNLAYTLGLSEKHVSMVLQGKAAASVEVWDQMICESRRPVPGL